MQLALLAASAAYLKSDFRAEKTGQMRGSAAGSELSSKEFSGEPDDRESMWGLPNGEVKRFVLAEKVSADDKVGSRTMGRAMGVGGSNRGSGGDPAPQREGAVPAAIPVEGRLPEGEVGLSEIGDVAETVFEPIPNGAGYSITADSASHFDLATKTVVFSGNVAMHNQAFTLHAKRLIVHLDKEDGQMKQMVANGDVDVTLLQGAEEERFRGWGEEAVFDPATNSIVFQGWPRILGHGREHRAASATTKMTIFVQPAKLVTVGRAQTRILAGQDGALPGMGRPASD